MSSHVDPTEDIRRELVHEINSNPKEREGLEQRFGQVWNTDEFCEEFEALGFLAPFVRVRRRSDGVEGLVEFQHHPRYYYQFEPRS